MHLGFGIDLLKLGLTRTHGIMISSSGKLYSVSNCIPCTTSIIGLWHMITHVDKVRWNV
ncbi:hypothetical protein NC651_027746 [Populus alba x Populus x berolinensis]|nr:hypothetical protein NC651_026978 [Populus alba x Populus x berolinensis]KAJ6887502.1 hypothetical protein NC651_027746 [Populus alba x Populus x berolinensis]